MKTMNLEQMECVSGGGRASLFCGGLMLGWGTILAYGFAAAPASAGISVLVSVGTGFAWGALSAVLCDIVGDAEVRHDVALK